MFSHREIYGDIYSEPCSYRRVGLKRLKCDLKSAEPFGGVHGYGDF